MKKKRRAPIEQLRQAGKIARQMLIERGIRPENSIIDKLLEEQKDGAPILPGIPSYLPHQWTLQAAQRMMYDLAIIWKDKTQKHPNKAENITDFFKFVISELRQQEKKYDKEVKETTPETLQKLKDVPVLKEIFAPVRKQEAIKAIHRFFIDSFAISIILKNNHSTSEYLNWFVSWTQDLYALWIKPEERENIKRT